MSTPRKKLKKLNKQNKRNERRNSPRARKVTHVADIYVNATLCVFVGASRWRNPHRLVSRREITCMQCLHLCSKLNISGDRDVSGDGDVSWNQRAVHAD